MCLKSSVIWLRALGPTAIGTAFAAAGIDDFGSAVGAGLASFGTVFDVAFEGAGHTAIQHYRAVCLPRQQRHGSADRHVQGFRH